MRTASATKPAGIGRIDTTIFPLNTPAGSQSMLVKYIGTFTPCTMWATGTLLSINACSKVNEQPMTNATVFSVQ